MRFRRHAAGNLAALRLDQRLRVVARQRGKRSGQHERLAGERPRCGALRRGLGPMHPGLAQIGDHRAIVRLGEKTRDARGDDRSNVVDLEQRGFVGGDQRVERAEVQREVARRRLPDLADAQREDEAGERRLLALFDGVDHVGRGLVGHPLEARQPGGFELVDVGRRVHDAAVDDLVDQLFAEAFDIHRAASGEMQQRLLALRRTEQAARAPRDRFVGQPLDRRAAFGALRRQDELPGARLARARHDANDFGDHVAGAPHDDRVADAHILAPHFVLVVQRRVGDGDAADEHRLQPRHRRDRAGAAHLHVDREHLGGHLLGRKLVRKCPARLARDEPELALQRGRVDLVDDAVDLERQPIAPRRDIEIELRQPGGPTRDAPVGIDRQSERFEGVEQRALAFRHVPAFGLADAVGEEQQRALRGHPRIDLAHRAGCSVAGIDVALATVGVLPRVQFGEVAPRHVHLAADLQQGRHLLPSQLMRDRLDRPDVAGHVFPDLAIAAGCAHGEPAVLVAQADREAVELELRHVLDGRCVGSKTEIAPDARVELAGGVGRRIGLRANRLASGSRDAPVRNPCAPHRPRAASAIRLTQAPDIALRAPRARGTACRTRRR
jgi:hypothetical protein